jgi:hypothetical protein
MRVLVAALMVASVIGCSSVTRVEGWAGGPVSAGIEDGQAVVTYHAPRAGWSLVVDRGRVDGDTALLWLTAKGPSSGDLKTTPVRATWSPDDGGSIHCVQANIRVLNAGDKKSNYLPAAVGCE